MNLKKICSIFLAVTMLGTSSAFFSVNAEEISYSLGDINLDSSVNYKDIISLQDYVNGDYTPSCSAETLLKIADLNDDKQISNSDIDELIEAFIDADMNLGDVNDDDRISVVDATEIQKYLVNLLDESFDIYQSINADYNKDGRVSVLDATEIQKELVGLNTKTDFPTASVKATDKECRKKYADYIEQYNLSDMLKGYYVVGQNSASSLIFRDEKWEYYYDDNNDVVGLCDYLGNSKTEILPAKLTNGRSIVKVAPCSDFSPVYTGTYNDKKAPYSNLENIFIPSSYRLMRNSFEGNKKIKNIFFASDNGVAHETSVFKNCSSLERVVLPSSMSTVPFAMFDGCKSIKKIVLPEGLTTVDKYAFRGTSISKLVVPKSVKVIKDEAFASPKLRDVYVMSKTTDLDITWLAAEGLQWSSLSLHGYKNSTLHDYWKLSEEEDLNVKMIFLD